MPECGWWGQKPPLFGSLCFAVKSSPSVRSSTGRAHGHTAGQREPDSEDVKMCFFNTQPAGSTAPSGAGPGSTAGRGQGARGWGAVSRSVGTS